MEFEQIQRAAAIIAPMIKKTPLIYSSFFSQEYKNQVYIKPENLQVTGAFKIRGACNKISQLTQEQKERGLVAASAGNHAQGVAMAAQRLGVAATIVMPAATPLIKVEATRSYGAEVVLYGDCYDDAHGKAMQLVAEHGMTLVHPFDDEEVIAGQGTIGMEILEELPDVDVVLVPIGGGGLASGVALAIKSMNPAVTIIGVEPKGAQTLRKSIQNDRITELKKLSTIAEGVAVKKAGVLTYAMVKEYVDDIVTVEDVDIMESFLLLLEKEKLIAENAGVLSLAAIRKLHLHDKKIVSIVSGGNIDVVTISELINRGLVVRGRVFCFAVELSDTPGELTKISSILSDARANIIKLDHNQFKTIDRFRHVQLEVTVETNGKRHVSQIKKALQHAGYEFEVVY
ncbi:threonine ammonia-lyase [Anaerotalea alkaliphila]|uniref:L-threonine dehydratase catabolic TdcB n=1 Tax=Anaerotalea alkaliphila TaxID=2662126 RepID=A0A7X5HX89_9FIRM|nr:threonine ammonia-lyase [Anaerotalea alkaliphila]NDL68171.1 threonine ammonia-lyase [Anaerotalea alkaliphila]